LSFLEGEAREQPEGLTKKPKATTGRFNGLVLRALKQEVNRRAGDLIENVLKPRHVEPPPKGHQLNYLVDITTEWLGPKCYFISVYRSPGPHAVSPTFETKFARMEYAGDGKFALSFIRHTGQWVQLYDDLTVDECLKGIQDDPWFQP
jgi:hypothetical protein